MTRPTAHLCIRSALLFCCAWMGIIPCGWAGDKIQFSGSAKTELPKAGGKRGVDIPDNLVNSNKRNAESEFQAIAPRPQGPTAEQRKKLEEYLDKKKNWMFVTENTDKEDSTPSIEELFGVREVSLDGSDEKPKKVMDEFFSEKKKNGNSKKDGASDSKSENFSPRKMDRAESRREFEEEEDEENPSNGIAELNLNRLIHPMENRGILEASNESRKPRLEGFQGALNANALKDPDRLKAQEEHDQDFRRLIQPRSTRPSAGGKMDPINMQSDNTRREINPVTAQRPDSMANFGSTERRIDPIRAINNSVVGNQPSALDSFSGPSASSLAPAIMAPFSPPPTRVETRPVPVLEFQRRKF